MAVIPEVKLFGKWSFEDIEVRSLLGSIISLRPLHEKHLHQDVILNSTIP